MVSCLNHFSLPNYAYLVLPLTDTSRNWKCRFGYYCCCCCCCSAFNISEMCSAWIELWRDCINTYTHRLPHYVRLMDKFPSVICKRIDNVSRHWHLSAVLQSGQSTMDIISPLAVSFCIFQVLHRLHFDAMRCDSFIWQTSINRIDMTVSSPSAWLSLCIPRERDILHGENCLISCRRVLLRAWWIFYEISRRVCMQLRKLSRESFKAL